MTFKPIRWLLAILSCFLVTFESYYVNCVYLYDIWLPLGVFRVSLADFWIYTDDWRVSLSGIYVYLGDFWVYLEDIWVWRLPGLLRWTLCLLSWLLAPLRWPLCLRRWWPLGIVICLLGLLGDFRISFGDVWVRLGDLCLPKWPLDVSLDDFRVSLGD